MTCEPGVRRHPAGPPSTLSNDLPAVDVEIKKEKVRQRCLELYPDRELLYDMVYESRFQRLWDQFRADRDEF